MDYFELKNWRNENSSIFNVQNWNSIPDSQAPIILPDNNNTANANTIDELIDSGNFIPPYEYYSGRETIQETDINSEGYIKNNIGTLDNTDVGYFWVEDLKNWCSYKVDYIGEFGNMFNLRIWNGRDNWIPIPNLMILYDPTWIKYDIYHIAKFQEPFMQKLKKITQNRGTCTGIGNNGEIQNTGWSLHLLNGFRLRKNTKYSTNDSNFQCIRWSTFPSKYNFYSKNTLSTSVLTYDGIVEFSKPGLELTYLYGYYLNNGNIPEVTYFNNVDVQDRLSPRPYMRSNMFSQVNCRSAIIQGAPCIWRLPSGEIMLAGNFCYNSDIGNPGYYKNSPNGFRKEMLDDGVAAQENCNWTGILGSDTFKAARWINSLCAKSFGTGTDKTIQNDWLREYNWAKLDTQYEENTYDNLLDSSLRFEQHNINKENTLKCKFTISRPVVTTTAKEEQDYARKW